MTQYEILLSNIQEGLEKLDNIKEMLDQMKDLYDNFKPLIDWVRVPTLLFYQIEP